MDCRLVSAGRAHAVGDGAGASGKSCCINPKGPTRAVNSRGDGSISLEHVIKGGSFLCHESYCESYRPGAAARDAVGHRVGAYRFPLRQDG